jgi:diaminopimelate decarboxylase
MVNADYDLLEGLSGLHFHTNCDETNFSGLLATVRHIKDIIPTFLDKISWVSMVGRYLFNEAENFPDFFWAVTIFATSLALKFLLSQGQGSYAEQR